MNLDPLSARIQTQIGRDGQRRMAVRSCRELIDALHRFDAAERTAIADVAHAIAGIEIMCAQLRHIVGHEKVDLETAERLHGLQSWLAGLEQSPQETMK